jgi:glycerol dehydrogenase-like iron-containing ADH family enzyme
MMMRTTDTGSMFTTIFGRNLIAELKHIANPPYLVVTMPDLWDMFAQHFDAQLAGPYLVHTIDGDALEGELATLPHCNSIIGLGGGQAIDVAKYFAWRKRLPLFQVPTSLTVNAPFGYRSGLRYGGNVRYVGFAVPEAVYIDFDVIQGAPKQLNRSGVCEIFCYHTAHADWRLADTRGMCEPKWRYEQRLVDEAREVLDTLMLKLDDIHAVNEDGIRALVAANRWGGATYHNAGWNPRHIEGVDHFVFYALEYYTGKKFIHGQPVCLGIYVGSLLHNDRADEMLAAIRRVGVDIRPQAMGITWDDVSHALKNLSAFVRQAGLWYSIAHEAVITDTFVAQVRANIEAAYADYHD